MRFSFILPIYRVTKKDLGNEKETMSKKTAVIVVVVIVVLTIAAVDIIGNWELWTNHMFREDVTRAAQLGESIISNDDDIEM